MSLAPPEWRAHITLMDTVQWRDRERWWANSCGSSSLSSGRLLPGRVSCPRREREREKALGPYTLYVLQTPPTFPFYVRGKCVHIPRTPPYYLLLHSLKWKCCLFAAAAAVVTGPFFLPLSAAS